jgi:sugar phosphate isomerase/epimerase
VSKRIELGIKSFSERVSESPLSFAPATKSLAPDLDFDPDLQEFLPQIRHVHAKDTELFEDARYEFGAQPATFAKPHGFGEWAWRYTIPGQGAARWGEIFSILSSGGYRGFVSVELEDENFNGTEAGEKAGLKQSLEYLRSA